MFCRSCGSATQNDEPVCASCRPQLGASKSQIAATSDKVRTNLNTRRRHVVIPLIIITLVLVALAGTFHLMQFAKSHAASSSDANNVFAPEQNDAPGYNGSQWGTSIEGFIDTVSGSSVRTDEQTPAPAIPACPEGSVPQRSNVGQYVRYSCKLPTTSDEMESCSEWEGSYWNTAVTVPCASRVSAAFAYTGHLACSISRQVYLLDRATGQLSKEITCLPAGWTDALQNGTMCPPGTVNGGPALFGEDHCYGPPPPSFLPPATADLIHTGSEDDADNDHELAQVLGVPNSEHWGGMLTYQDTDFSVIPPNFQTISKDDAEYVFYKGRLAMVYSALNVHHRVEVVADLMNKYSEVAKSKYGWTRHTLDDGPPDSTDVNVTLFRRGKTNTRIYLIDRVDHETGTGVEISSLHVLYVPTSSMWEIQHDVQALADQHRAASQASAQHAAQSDINKIQ
jgi:hypothetical protein